MPVVPVLLAPITDQPLIAMPNRVIRDGLLDSEAILTSPIEARWLFVTICLQADDIGFFEATPFKLARKADLDVKLTSKLLLMLAEEDLIRPYTVENKQYGFIPRFRQRLQIRKLKYPLPPECIYRDDPDALNKIKDLASNPTVAHLLDNGCPSAAQPPEAEAEAEAEGKLHGTSYHVVPQAVASGTKSKTKLKPLKAEPLGAYAVPDCPYAELVAMFHEALPALPRVDIISDQRKRHMNARWRAVCADMKADKAAGLDWFKWFYQQVAASPFLMGQVSGRDGKPPFRAHFDWLFTPEKFIRIAEGFYNRK